MSLVLLSHACSHLQNASLARLGLTSLPSTTLLHTLMLQMQKSGYLSTVTIGGPTPPPPSALSPTFSSQPEEEEDDDGAGSGFGGLKQLPGAERLLVTQTNVSTRRLWVGLKYYNNTPVLSKLQMVSKPTRRVWMGVQDLEGLVLGDRRGYVKGLRAVGESMYVSTDRGILEVRECVERKTGGMLLCRVNPVG